MNSGQKTMTQVCMVIEGAYPYITGGVSAWCHKLITDIKDVEFSLLVILPASYRGKSYKYEIPDNVKAIHEVWLDRDYFKRRKGTSNKKDIKTFFNEIEHFHTSMKLKNYGQFTIISKLIDKMKDLRITLRTLTKSKQVIQSLFNIYNNNKKKSGFMQYFWTWKSTHLPLFRILNFPLPKADVYHAVSTGYAGFLSTIAKLRHNIPFILTEHGIYAMEREDELKASEFISRDQKDLWIRFFHSFCRISYSFADKIITLYKGNEYIEVSNNANIDKIEIIPNGVDIKLYLSLKKLPSPDRLRVGIVARVVPIKDVKAFIRAAAIVKDQYEDADFFIVGPTDEDEEYYEECVEMVKELDLGDRLKFAGKQDMKEYYPKLDILVLTSAREAQPLVLLEAMCSGIPCIATDVGSCREMLDNVGFVTTPGKPEETAEAIIKLCSNTALRNELIEKGRDIVKMNYNVIDVIKSYRSIYHKYSEKNRVHLMEKKWLA